MADNNEPKNTADFMEFMNRKQKEFKELNPKDATMVAMAMYHAAALRSLENHGVCDAELTAFNQMGIALLMVVNREMGADRSVWGNLVADVLEVVIPDLSEISIGVRNGHKNSH